MQNGKDENKIQSQNLDSFKRCIAKSIFTDDFENTLQENECGKLIFENVCGKTVASTSYATYPLKFMLPNKIARKGVDAVWVYAITYGGGIVAGDTVSFSAIVKERCTAVITTQASTKIYHSNDGKVGCQFLMASISDGGLLAVIPDAVTCFANSKFRQRQNFHLTSDANLIFVDWVTSGRLESNEHWAFDLYESLNHVYVRERPILLEKIRLQKESSLSIADRMKGMHVIATIFIYGPRLIHVRQVAKSYAKEVATSVFSSNKNRSNGAFKSDGRLKSKANKLYVSFSEIGLEEALLIKVCGVSTDQVYDFMKTCLLPLSSEIGSIPYANC